MSSHAFTDAEGRAFDVTIGVTGEITDVAGPWPDGPTADFELHGMLPPHTAPAGVPDRVRALAIDRGLEVCFYDPVNCRTCFCDGTGRIVRCSKMC